MCDYSLHSIKNRLANEGEQLCIHRFQTGSKGMASLSEIEALKGPSAPLTLTNVWAQFRNWLNEAAQSDHSPTDRQLHAVCIPPGARLQMGGIPSRMQLQYGVGPSEEVTFVQLSADPFKYRDAIRFSNGTEVLLQKLPEGLKMDVICLSLPEEEPVTPRPMAARAMANIS